MNRFWRLLSVGAIGLLLGCSQAPQLLSDVPARIALVGVSMQWVPDSDALQTEWPETIDKKTALFFDRLSDRIFRQLGQLNPMWSWLPYDEVVQHASYTELETHPLQWVYLAKSYRVSGTSHLSHWRSLCEHLEVDALVSMALEWMPLNSETGMDWQLVAKIYVMDKQGRVLVNDGVPLDLTWSQWNATPSDRLIKYEKAVMSALTKKNLLDVPEL